MDKWIEKSLATWYPKTHKLHLEPLHPALGLAGEAGELLDVWKKHSFKKGYDAWDCKLCGMSGRWHGLGYSPGSNYWQDEYTPIILDELGDLTYYPRILFYQVGLKFPEPYKIRCDILDILTGINWSAANLLKQVQSKTRQEDNELFINTSYLGDIWASLYPLCELLDTELETVLEMNWNKLKGGDNNGWRETLEDAKN